MDKAAIVRNPGGRAGIAKVAAADAAHHAAGPG
jgi:hypothetical protein